MGCWAGGGSMPPPNPNSHQWNTSAPSATKWEAKGEPLDAPYSNGTRSGNQPYGGGASNNYMSQPQQMMFNEAMNNPVAMPFQPFNPNQNLWMNQGGMEVPFGRNENPRNVSGPFPNQFNAPPMGHHYGPPPME
uniref:Uncharacterized protein n=1 Tax=Ditylenchus dipsaci TaxID=166011 RepID=A0A915DGJ2_9BILA